MNLLIKQFPAELHRELRIRAAMKGMTLKKAVEDAIRTWVKQDGRRKGVR